MRTPNSKCIICGKERYRKPNELKKAKIICCKGCRSLAYKKYSNKNRLKNLELGREKGTNHLEGLPKSKEMKAKVKLKNKLFWSKNKFLAMERGKKISGEKHYNWKGGITELQRAIRACSNNKKWINAILKRDKCCVVCNSELNLEVHHKIGVAKILKDNCFTSLEEAKNYLFLWDVNNGVVLCRKCHYKVHNRSWNYVD